MIRVLLGLLAYHQGFVQQPTGAVHAGCDPGRECRAEPNGADAADLGGFTHQYTDARALPSGTNIAEALTRAAVSMQETLAFIGVPL